MPGKTSETKDREAAGRSPFPDVIAGVRSWRTNDPHGVGVVRARGGAFVAIDPAREGGAVVYPEVTNDGRPPAAAVGFDERNGWHLLRAACARFKVRTVVVEDPYAMSRMGAISIGRSAGIAIGAVLGHEELGEEARRVEVVCIAPAVWQERALNLRPGSDRETRLAAALRYLAQEVDRSARSGVPAGVDLVRLRAHPGVASAMGLARWWVLLGRW